MNTLKKTIAFKTAKRIAKADLDGLDVQFDALGEWTDSDGNTVFAGSGVPLVFEQGQAYLLTADETFPATPVSSNLTPVRVTIR